MALIGPILDDRSFEQLKDELVKRIPVFAPEWTDHNESDPGISPGRGWGRVRHKITISATTWIACAWTWNAKGRWSGA